MYCEVCGRSGGHLPNCPENTNYEENEFIPNKKCDFCGEMIEDGELYIENNNGEYAHLNCVDIESLCDFLAIDIDKEGGE
jgi:hypothetical protein